MKDSVRLKRRRKKKEMPKVEFDLEAIKEIKKRKKRTKRR
jgi:hypothetical protein